MICKGCKQEIPDASMFCPKCGYFLCGKGASEPKEKASDSNPPAAPEDNKSDAPKRSMSGISIAGFVLSLISLLVLPFILGVLGLIFSAVGLGTTGAAKKRGKGFAIAGFILSLISLTYRLLSCVACFAIL